MLSGWRKIRLSCENFPGPASALQLLLRRMLWWVSSGRSSWKCIHLYVMRSKHSKRSSHFMTSRIWNISYQIWLRSLPGETEESASGRADRFFECWSCADWAARHRSWWGQREQNKHACNAFVNSGSDHASMGAAGRYQKKVCKSLLQPRKSGIPTWTCVC